MRREFQFKTLKGVAVKLTVSPSGFIKIERAGAQPKSIALLSFARSVLMNPSSVQIEPTEDGAEILLPDSVWELDAENMTIVKSEHEVETLQTPQTVVEEEVVQVAAEQASEPEQQQPEKPQFKPSQRKEVKTMQNGYKPRWAIALESILKSQGFSDEQIQNIIASVAADSRARQPKETIDTSTPEGKIIAMLASVVKDCRRNKLSRHSFTFDLPSGDEAQIIYENGTASLFVNSQRIASYPN